jgi:hypothetical protein
MRRRFGSHEVFREVTSSTDGLVSSPSFALAGPAERPDPAHTPVRGDLAHIRLAGKVFVPHYVRPLPYRAARGAALLRAPGGDVLTTLAPGAAFDVLDMAAGHAWGESTCGFVGYVALDHLECVA